MLVLRRRTMFKGSHTTSFTASTLNHTTNFINEKLRFTLLSHARRVEDNESIKPPLQDGLKVYFRDFY